MATEELIQNYPEDGWMEDSEDSSTDQLSTQESEEIRKRSTMATEELIQNYPEDGWMEDSEDFSTDQLSTQESEEIRKRSTMMSRELRQVSLNEPFPEKITKLTQAKEEKKGIFKKTTFCGCEYLLREEYEDEASQVRSRFYQLPPSMFSEIIKSAIDEHSGPILTFGSHMFCECCQGEDKEECPVYQKILKEYPQDKVDSKMYEYPMASKTRGLCLIISNKKFPQGKDGRDRDRYGTERDVESLSWVFSWLGFRVLMCVDKTATGMKQVLKLISKLLDLSELQRCGLYEYQNGGYTPLQDLPQHGDTFVCCILSHGGQKGVCGIDDEVVSIDDITSPFNSLNCPGLLGRPKAFFIQACRGGKHMEGVYANIDSNPNPGGSTGHEMQTTLHPSEADFLVVRATVQNFVSYRGPCTGSFFIQTLCNQLISDCPRGENILNILTVVNDKVSQMDGIIEIKFEDGTTIFYLVRQISEATFTLRKQLVFPAIQP